jgi:hypothetical protein
VNLIIFEIKQEKTEIIKAFGHHSIEILKSTITACLINDETECNKGGKFEEWTIENRYVKKQKEPVILQRESDRKRIKVFIDKGFESSQFKIPEFILYKYEDL